MKLKKGSLRDASQFLMALSFIAILAAGWGFVATDIWLASTQWLLVAAVLAVFGLYTRLES